MKECNKCREKAKENDIFCSKCGNNLAEENKSETQSETLQAKTTNNEVFDDNKIISDPISTMSQVSGVKSKVEIKKALTESKRTEKETAKINILEEKVERRKNAIAYMSLIVAILLISYSVTFIYVISPALNKIISERTFSVDVKQKSTTDIGLSASIKGVIDFFDGSLFKIKGISAFKFINVDEVDVLPVFANSEKGLDTDLKGAFNYNKEINTQKYAAKDPKTLEDADKNIKTGLSIGLYLLACLTLSYLISRLTIKFRNKTFRKLLVKKLSYEYLIITFISVMAIMLITFLSCDMKIGSSFSVLISYALAVLSCIICLFFTSHIKTDFLKILGLLLVVASILAILENPRSNMYFFIAVVLGGFFVLKGFERTKLLQDMTQTENV